MKLKSKNKVSFQDRDSVMKMRETIIAQTTDVEQICNTHVWSFLYRIK